MPFEEGQTKTGGRTLGTPNKSTQLMLDVKDVVLRVFQTMQEDTDENKDITLLAWGRKNPGDFYKIAAKLIPTQLNAEVTENRIIIIPPNVKPKKIT